MLFKTSEIRPELKTYKIGVLLLDLAVALGFIISIAGILIAVYLLKAAYCSDFLILLALCALLFIVNVLLYKKLRVPYVQKLLEASELIAIDAGRSAILCFPGVAGYSGLLLEVKDDNPSGPRIICLGVPKTFKIPKDALEVILKSDPTGQFSTIVVQIGKRYFIGSAKDHVGMQQELLRMKVLLSGLLYLSIMFVVALGAYMVFENNHLENEIERARASVTYPTVEAHIISSEVAETKVQKGKVKRSAWYPKVSYACTIGGLYQTGERLSIAAIVYFDKAMAQEIAARYPPGSIHPLYYDPDEPTFTVLEPGHEDILINDRMVFLIKWSCILVVIIALAIVFQLCRKKLVPKIEALANSDRTGSSLH